MDELGNVVNNTDPQTLPRKIAYDKLTDLDSQIRLLHIEPGAPTAPIRATLKTYNRKKTPFYDAISYTWGDPILAKTIFINGQPVDVRYNCWFALWQVRLHKKSHFWIDALCINQVDVDEKSAQVREMHKTFGGAYAVHCCVGSHASDSEWFCTQVSYLQDALKYYVSDQDAEKCEDTYFTIFMESILKTDQALARFVAAFNNFCSRPFFSRLWTLQEIVFGQRKQIWCGEAAVDFGFLMKLLLTFADTGHRQSMLTLGDIDYFSEVALRRDWKNKSLNHLMPMEQPGFLGKLCSKQCSDPRDLFYGSLSITDLDMVPDYSKSPSQVAREAITLLVSSYKSAFGKRDRVFHELGLERTREDILQVLKRMTVRADGQSLEEGKELIGPQNHENGRSSSQRGCEIELRYRGPIGQLRTNGANQLFVNWDEITLSDAAHDLFHDRRLKGHESQEGVVEILISRDGLHAGVMRAGARAGDLLIPNGTVQDVGWERYFVVKWHCPLLFSVIGQAIVFPPLDPTHRSSEGRLNQDVEFDIELHMYLHEFIDTCFQAMIPLGVNPYAWAIHCTSLGLKSGTEERLYTQVKRMKQTAEDVEDHSGGAEVI